MRATPETNNSISGDTVLFTCSADGGPGNEFNWTYLRNPNDVLSSMELLNLTSTAMIGGDYQCLVSNLAGNESATVTLNGN